MTVKYTMRSLNVLQEPSAPLNEENVTKPVMQVA